MARTTTTDLESNVAFQNKPAYRYIRKSDRLPTYDEIPHDKPLDQIVCKVRLFNPTGIGTWHVAAYDPDTRVAWGVAQLQEKEVGSWSMDELTSFRGRFGLPIERDLYGSPKTISAVLADRNA